MTSFAVSSLSSARLAKDVLGVLRLAGETEITRESR